MVFNLDLAANYHDPDLVPPHSYLACYFWLRHEYRVDAMVHVGKHGNLEWLPGKGSGLSNQCWPDIALGPMPHFYPFIVNDPGEGAQAKRRAQAVIIDHLMPPMTRAETYGELAQLEALVDEYYQALGMDGRREQWLRDEILKAVQGNPGLRRAERCPRRRPMTKCWPARYLALRHQGSADSPRFARARRIAGGATSWLTPWSRCCACRAVTTRRAGYSACAGE